MTRPPGPDQPAPWGPPPGGHDPVGDVDWEATPPPPGPPPAGYGPPYGWPQAPAGWSAPPPPQRSTTARTVLLTVGAVGVLVTLVAVLLVVAVRGDDEVAARPVAAPTATAGATAPDPDGFLAALPGDLSDCTATAPAGDGDVAAATCGPADSQPGPDSADFHLYPDAATLADVFAADVADLGLTELAPDLDCTEAMGQGEWTYATGVTGGRVACGLTDDGTAVVAWTDEAHLAEGALLAPGTTQADVAALYEWWTVHSEYTD